MECYSPLIKTVLKLYGGMVIALGISSLKTNYLNVMAHVQISGEIRYYLVANEKITIL